MPLTGAFRTGGNRVRAPAGARECQKLIIQGLTPFYVDHGGSRIMSGPLTLALRFVLPNGCLVTGPAGMEASFARPQCHRANRMLKALARKILT